MCAFRLLVVEQDLADVILNMALLVLEAMIKFFHNHSLAKPNICANFEQNH